MWYICRIIKVADEAGRVKRKGEVEVASTKRYVKCVRAPSEEL